MRKMAVFAAVCLAGCDGSLPGGTAAVDTTAAAEPDEGRSAILSGKLSFPSDYIPDDMRICAETKTGTTLCDAEIFEEDNTHKYRLEVPPGTYHVYAQTEQLPGRRAYYSRFVTCGMSSGCPSHDPIEVTVKAGESRAGVDPGDWYVSESEDGLELGMSSEDAQSTSSTEALSDVDLAIRRAEAAINAAASEPDQEDPFADE